MNWQALSRGAQLNENTGEESMTGKATDVGQWFRRFLASGIYGEVSGTTIQGYLRSASQIEDVWQQIDDSMDALIQQGMAPWDAYTKMGYALAFVRACRTNVVFVQELLKAAAFSNSGQTNYLPRVTYDQALVLCEHIEPLLEEAIKASTQPHYTPSGYPFPLEFGPHIKYMNQQNPLSHLQGTIGAAQEMKDWAAGLLAQYELALGTTKLPIPQAVSIHLEEMKNELRLGDFHLQSGVDMVGQISRGQVTGELSEKAEDFLWEAVQSFFKVSQLVAYPAIPMHIPRINARVVDSTQQFHGRRPLPSAPPIVNQKSAVQPLPDISGLLGTETAASGPSRDASIYPSHNVNNLLNQVTADPTPPRHTPKEPFHDVANLLDQATTGPQPKTKQEIPTPPSKRSDAVHDSPHLASPTPPEKDILNLLSDVCGEQKNDIGN